MDEVAIEQAMAGLVTERVRALVRESVRAWLPEMVARQVQAEMARKPSFAEPSEGFDQRVRDAFAPQIAAIARQMAREQVARDLPKVAERMILAELARL